MPTKESVFGRHRLIFRSDVSSLRALFASNHEDSNVMRKWQCIVCGWIYDEAEGYADEGIAPGTSWDDVPQDFVCPECGVGKDDFEMIEVG